MPALITKLIVEFRKQVFQPLFGKRNSDFPILSLMANQYIITMTVDA